MPQRTSVEGALCLPIESPDLAERDPEHSKLRDQLVTHYACAYRKREVRWRKGAVALDRGLARERRLFAANRGYRDQHGEIRYPSMDDEYGWDEEEEEEVDHGEPPELAGHVGCDADDVNELYDVQGSSSDK